MNMTRMMKAVYVLITLGSFGMLSWGWIYGKVDNTTFITLAVAAVGGSLWAGNRTPKPPNP